VSEKTARERYSNGAVGWIAVGVEAIAYRQVNNHMARGIKLTDER
jgi:hypothetical protein